MNLRWFLPTERETEVDTMTVLCPQAPELWTLLVQDAEYEPEIRKWRMKKHRESAQQRNETEICLRFKDINR